MIVLHNPSCSTSRNVLEILKKKKIKFQIRNYVKEPLDKVELKELLEKLGMNPVDLVRKKEKLYQEELINKKLSKAQWLSLFQKHPLLIERPVLIDGERAIIGRPLEKVLDFLKKV